MWTINRKIYCKKKQYRLQVRMVVILNILRSSFCLIVIITMTTGLELYGECLKFGASEVQPDIPNIDWYCINEGGFKYCRFYACACTKCESPNAPTKGKCSYCKGTCSYGGNIYNVGKSFTCLDRVNHCRCAGNNNIISTRISQNPQTMCKA